jgi:hypothetical protein
LALPVEWLPHGRPVTLIGVSLIICTAWPNIAVKSMSNQHQRNCPCCGNEIPGAMRFCPICMLRKGLAGEVESGQSSLFEETIKLSSEQMARRLEHYELVKGEDGKPVELGKLSTIRRRPGERQIKGDQKTCRRQPAL